MEEKLTLEHLAVYLPYGLDTIYKLSDVIIYPGQDDELRHKVLTSDNIDFVLKYCKPLLHPLLKLTQEIEHDGERFFPSNEFFLIFGAGVNAASVINWKINFIDNILYTPYTSLSYDMVKKLFEWHFDVFGLIEKGLAIEK